MKVRGGGTTKKSGTNSSSKMAISLDARGLFAICGSCKNSSRDIEPEPSLEGAKGALRTWVIHMTKRGPYVSSFMNRFFNRSNSLALTARESDELCPPYDTCKDTYSWSASAYPP